MDRQIVYAGAIPLETDLLNTNKNAMLAIGGIASALFGASSTVNGLTVTPTSPATMQVVVGAGEIYTRQNVDNTAYGSLAADTAHQTVKQGINLAPVLLPCPAPATTGYSVNYLIQATFQESDTGPVTLPYYNSSDPTHAYSGPSNSGTQQPTMRSGTVLVSAKPGIAAATGTQATPTVDAGYIAVCVVSVAFGATSITAGQISPISSASIVPFGGILAAIQSIAYATRAEGLAGTVTNRIVSPDVMAQSIQAGVFLYAVAAGTPNALTASLTPAPASLRAGLQVVIKATAANTNAATLNLNSTGPVAITYNGGPVGGGMLRAGQLHSLTYDGATWQLRTPSIDGVIAYSLGASGYEVYSHGKIVQWGGAVAPISSTSLSGIAINFPIAFPTAVFGVLPTSTTPSATGWDAALAKCPASTLTLTGCTLTVDTCNPSFHITQPVSLFWRAEGN